LLVLKQIAKRKIEAVCWTEKAQRDAFNVLELSEAAICACTMI